MSSQIDIIFKRNFINADTCNEMNAWVDEGVRNKWLDCGMSSGTRAWSYKNRMTTRNYGDRFDYPLVVYDVFNKITATLGLQNVKRTGAGGGKNSVVVSCTFPGGDVYAHTDGMDGDLHVLRCNIMTRSADVGGELFIAGKQIDTGVGDLHCYLPSANEHYVRVVKGNTSRVLWMFGYSVTKEFFDKLN